MRKRIFSAVVVAAFYLALWQIGSIAVGQKLLLPEPLSVLRELGALAAQKSFWEAVAFSLLRILGGYAAGLLLGAALAAACYALWPLRTLTRPLMGVIRATPIASFIILAFYMLRAGRVPMFTAFLMVLPVVFANILEGLDRTDRKLLEMARVFRIPRGKMALTLHLPAALPYAMTAAVTGLGLAWKAGIAAEVLGNSGASIGGALRSSKASLDTPGLFAWTLVVIALSLALESLFRALLGRASARLGEAGVISGEASHDRV